MNADADVDLLCCLFLGVICSQLGLNLPGALHGVAGEVIYPPAFDEF